MIGTHESLYAAALAARQARTHSDSDNILMCFVLLLQQGKLIRTLKGHGHWVNTLALSTEHALRTGAFDHTGSAPSSPEAAKQVTTQS